MTEIVKYISFSGRAVFLNSSTIVCSYKQIRQFAYNIGADGTTTRNLSKDFPLTVVCVGRETADDLLTVLLEDAVNDTQGRLYIGEWYLLCKFKGISSNVDESNNLVKLTLAFTAPDLTFLKARQYTLAAQNEDAETYLDFDYDLGADDDEETYGIDYGADYLSLRTVFNAEVEPADYIIQFTGVELSSIVFTVADKAHTIDTMMTADEVFYLNTSTKECYKLTAQGKVDLFSVTDDDNYIFERIPVGYSTVVWTTAQNIDFRVLERRAVARWI